MVKWWCIVVMVLFLAVPAFGSFVPGSLVSTYTDGSGTHWSIDGTGILLFEPPAPYDPSGPSDDLWGQNNASPLWYPNVTPPYYPPPGEEGDYKTGEHVDLEGLFPSYDPLTGSLDIWLVTSIGPDGYHFTSRLRNHFGDIFIDVDGGGYDYALLSFDQQPGTLHDGVVFADGSLTWDGTSSRNAGSLAVLDDSSILYGINGSSWALDPSITGVLDPWVVNNPVIAEAGDLVYQQITAGTGISDRDAALGPDGYPPSASHDTYVYRWSVTLPTGLDLSSMDFHVANQFGDDLIEAVTVLAIPAPGAVWLAVAGTLVLIASRRARKAA